MQTLRTDDWDAVEPVDGVQLTRLVSGENMSILHYRIEPGARVPEHSHHHEQTGYVLSGEVTFEVEDDEITLNPGDSYVLESEEVHAAENRGDEPMEGLDIFSPPRSIAPYEE